MAQKMDTGDDPKNELTSKDYYFDSYAHFGIHEEMLKDQVRTLTYRKAIEGNKHLFSGKIVLDVGCGTGILSMFAARAGAKHVYSIECSTIIEQAKMIVRDNGLSDAITLIQGKVEEVTLPVEKVDIIISEWMGYALLYESMMKSVLFARDKWMAPNGVMLPDKSQLFLSTIEDSEYKDQKIAWWENVYGFNMSCIKELAIAEPLVDVVNPNQVNSDVCKILDLNCETMAAADLDFSAPFTLTFQRNDYVHAFVAHFDCQFGSSHTPVEFSTGAHAPYTHWKQTVFYLKEVLTVKAGESISGKFTCTANSSNPRDLDFIVEYEFNGSLQKAKGKQQYRMR